MKVHALPDAEAACREAANFIVARGRQAISAKGRFVLALSGGTSPLPMFAALSAENLQWECVHLFQVDERLVPADSPERNFAGIREHLLAKANIPSGQIYPMPVDLVDPATAAATYAATLRYVLGDAGVLDLVHLGLGADGHTASLLPDDPALEERSDVIVSRHYQGYRRLSLSLHIISAARERLWLVTGKGKERALEALLNGDPTLPAGRVPHHHSTLYHSGSDLSN
jgi:6-phosphogluconolactonase